MPFPLSMPLGGMGRGYQIPRSLRFNSADSAGLSRTFSAGNRRTWTWSGWAKRSAIGSGTRQALFGISDGVADTNTLEFGFEATTDTLYTTLWTTNNNSTAVYRDPAAWYHVCIAFDTTQATAANRCKIWVNGSLVTMSTTLFSQNTDYGINRAAGHGIGCLNSGGSFSRYFNGYIAEVHFVDGTALAPTDFGQTDATTGQWVPKRVTGVTYGTNGFYLSFYDNTSTTTLGRDDAGGLPGSAAGSNDWTLNNFSVTAGVGNDSSLDTPTNNHCTLQQLNNDGGTLSNGGLRFIGPTSHRIARGTFLIPSTGKWAYRCRITSAPFSPRGTTSAYTRFGAVSASVLTIGGTLDTVRGNALLLGDGGYLNNFATGNGTDSGATIANGDAIDLELDRTANTFAFTRSGVTLASGTINTTAGADLVPVVVSYDGSYAIPELDFGQNNYTPPAGYKTLCAQNLPTPTIVKPSAQFNVATYTGNATARSITGLGHQPDLLWLKNRGATGSHHIVDSSRGVANVLFSDSTAAEASRPLSVTAFGTDGFSLGTGSDGNVNTNTNTYVAWGWKEGVTPGLDIVTFTGPSGAGNVTMSHSLGVTPAMFIVKTRGTSAGWWVNHKGLANQSDKYLGLHQTNAVATLSWGAAPTSSQFTVSDGFVTQTAATCIAYLFAEVAGFSRFGSYTGNGSADGPFVHCGFRPRFVMVKTTSGVQSWIIEDGVRTAYNPIDTELFPDLSQAEANAASNGRPFDLLSNGFKIRGSNAVVNGSGSSYIYAAFAEAPFKYANAR